MVSGYTFCPCRDCSDTVIADNVMHPEVCDDCKDAGCSSIPNFPSECQRDDAYSV